MDKEDQDCVPVEAQALWAIYIKASPGTVVRSILEDFAFFGLISEDLKGSVTIKRWFAEDLRLI